MFNSRTPAILFITVVLFSVHICLAQGKIIMNGATMKMVNGAYVSTSDLTIVSGSVIADSSTVRIAGNISNAGVFDLKKGTLEMNGSVAQTIPADAITNNILKNLIASNSFSLAGQDSITNTLSFGGSNEAVTTGGFLTLKSTAAATARVADITNGGANSGNTISGNVKVERYLYAVRAWRFLTAPVTTTQTINAAWQEGQTGTNNVPGYGTFITGGTIANGFDQGVNNNAAIERYMAGSWPRVANTNSTLINSENGFMVFFRGNRSTNLGLGTNAPVTSATVRSTGALKTNNQTYTVAATGFTVIGNPYASPIDLHSLTKNNVKDNFYVWDPKLAGINGLGSFVNISWNGSQYDFTPSSGGSGLTQYIQSGTAFLAGSGSIDGTSTGTLTIKETDKSATPSINANRPAGPAIAKLETNLYLQNSTNTTSILDGILNSYGAQYSDNLDEYDALKIRNFSESLSSERYGQLLVTERRQPLTSADTIFLNLYKMKVKSYQFELVAYNFSSNGLAGYLEDHYLSTRTPLDLQGTTKVNFNILNNPGSSDSNRFRIVFAPATSLPVTFSAVKAFAQNADVKVEWTVGNEGGIKMYDVEKSADGKQFVKVNTVVAKGNTNASNYTWLDVAAFDGNNYYRIKSIDFNGGASYSIIMKVDMGKVKTGIALQTNVITSNTLILQLINMPKGAYTVSVSNSLGQILFTKKIEHEYGSSTESIRLNSQFVTGIYHISIIKPDLTNQTMKLFIQ